MKAGDIPKRIGIFGGSFNPVHRAHCRIAEEFIDQAKCDICYFIPTAVSPFKEEQPLYVNDMHRLTMLRLATEYHPKFLVSDIEILRGGVSYTIDTINALRELHPHSQLFLLIGQDQAGEFHRWKDWKLIVDYVQLCIVRRPDTIAQQKEITKQLTHANKVPQWIQCLEMNISSTEIRENIRQGIEIDEMVSPQVMEYIQVNHLYGYKDG
ncbi:MAG: nicotinate (nicotinamide) nucleotide adenylyltransferase [Ignavibacteria bacterium]|nr:nicotinate (nicotinamide) nucleotide adenylyltransferase [Ignavibacteria bacterium]